MRKIGIFGLLFFFMLSFACCNDNRDEENINNPELTGDEQEEENDFDKELVPNSQGR